MNKAQFEIKNQRLKAIIQKNLIRATPYIRKELQSSLKFRLVPEIRFYQSDTLEKAYEFEN